MPDWGEIKRYGADDSIDASNCHSGDRVAPVGLGGTDIACSLNPIADVNEAFGLSRIMDMIPTGGTGYELTRLGIGLASRVVGWSIQGLGSWRGIKQEGRWRNLNTADG